MCNKIFKVPLPYIFRSGFFEAIKEDIGKKLANILLKDSNNNNNNGLTGGGNGEYFDGGNGEYFDKYLKYKYKYISLKYK